jgi:hypothetical protein
MITVIYLKVSRLFFFLNKIIHVCFFFSGQTGLRGYVDRIVQHAEQLAIDRPVGTFAAGYGGGSTTISRTVINAGGGGGVSSSSMGFGGSTGTSGISTLISSSTRPASSYQTVTSSSKSTYQTSGGSNLRSSGDF